MVVRIDLTHSQNDDKEGPDQHSISIRHPANVTFLVRVCVCMCRLLGMVVCGNILCMCECLCARPCKTVTSEQANEQQSQH